MIETERKFLVVGNDWKKEITKKYSIRQGYLVKTHERTVRIRVSDKDAYITVKGKRIGISCPEFEYSIPLSDAEKMLKMSVTPVLKKTRHCVYHNGNLWEVDVFKGLNKGLVMAEFEYSDSRILEIPPWAGLEVSYDKRYVNSHIAEHVVPHT